MKKNSLIILGVVVVAAFTAYGLSIKKSADISAIATAEVVMDEVAHVPTAIEAAVPTKFIYNIGPRFQGITKSTLAEASSVHDFLDEKALARLETFQQLAVILIENDRETDKQIIGTSPSLTKAQKDFLKAMPYSQNFMISVRFLERNEYNDALDHQHWRPALTLVPEVQASYSEGMQNLKTYFEKHIYNHTTVIEEGKLGAAKLYFTVSKHGTIEDVRLDRSSGYPIIDEKMKALLLDAPGTWEAAKDKNGNAVAQELVVSFGLEGC